MKPTTGDTGSETEKGTACFETRADQTIETEKRNGTFLQQSISPLKPKTQMPVLRH